MQECVREHKVKIGCCCCVTFIATIVTLLAISFKTLEQTEVGIDFSTVSMKIDDTQLYQPGQIHFLGPGHEFITFSTKALEVQFHSRSSFGTLDARTLDGLLVTLETSFQYTLKSDDLEEMLALYYDWGDDHATVFAVLARNVLRDVTARHEAYALIRNRTVVQAEMKNALRATIEENHGELTDFQLTDVLTDHEFKTRLQAVETTRQLEVKSTDELSVATQNAENLRNKVYEDVQQEVAPLRAHATVTMNRVKQQIFEFTKDIDAEMQSYSMFADEAQIPPNGMLEYIWLQNFGKGESAIKAKLPKPVSLTCTVDSSDYLCPSRLTSSEYNCVAGQVCDIELNGAKFTVQDRAVFVAAGDTCPPATATDALSPVEGSLTHRKLYSIPDDQVTLADGETSTQLRLCVCLASGSPAGCRSASDFVNDAGLVTFASSDSRL